MRARFVLLVEGVRGGGGVLMVIRMYDDGRNLGDDLTTRPSACVCMNVGSGVKFRGCQRRGDEVMVLNRIEMGRHIALACFISNATQQTGCGRMCLVEES